MDTNNSQKLLARLREGEELSVQQQIQMAVRLSLPAMLAQVSSVVMQYIDASMVGRLGAADSASIGLVLTSTWLFGGVCMAACLGFTVQAAQAVGAREDSRARRIMHHGLGAAFLFSLALTLLALCISSSLPRWLGGAPEICTGASRYFLIYMLGLPAFQLSALAGGMLQASGNMRVPSILNVLTCALDVVFNALLIFPTGTYTVLGVSVTLPGAGMGIAGAALGTTLAEVVTALLMLAFLLLRSPEMKLRRGEPWGFTPSILKKALRIAAPVGFEQVVMCGAQVMATRIVSPLGTIAIAANSFAVTAESLCYMPGYGIAAAATALIGQSIGARRGDLARRLGWISTGLGMAVMTCTGVLMYAAAPFMIGLLSPVESIRQLGTEVLRIEAFAEPLFAASIVCTGAFRGAGDTLAPSCMNFFSMWGVRLPLAAFLAPRVGLRGVWIAMCIELCVRGTLFLARLKTGRWLTAAQHRSDPEPASAEAD